MTVDRIRDYPSLLTRLDNCLDGTGKTISIGEFPGPGRKYDCRKIVLGKGNPLRVLISAGIHGDEPAGVETVCEFLESERYKKYLDRWEFTILPCLNPSGYELGGRENHREQDLNRLFKSEDPPPEVVFAKSVFVHSYTLTLELHEDTESPGYYLYQKTSPELEEGPGRPLLNSVKEIMPINMDSDIDGTEACEGLIDRLKGPEDMEWWPMALFAVSRGAECCLTLESAMKFPMETRISAHLRAVQKALDFFS